MSGGKHILVVANETVGGAALIDAVKRHADSGQVSVHVICPQNEPKHGYVVYEETVRAAAENRLAMTIAELEEIGVEATSEVMDPDPYSAIMDALGEHEYDEIIISSHPETRSGWLRQNLITRVQQATSLPVEHVVVELDAEEKDEEDEDDGAHTLVVANQTVGGQALIDQLKALAEEGPRHFIVISPVSGDDDDDAPERLAHTLDLLREEGLDATGQVAHPDPYTAIQNALHIYAIDEVVISTFPETRSGWLRSDLIDRVRSATSKPVHHVVSEDVEGENLEEGKEDGRAGGDEDAAGEGERVAAEDED
jgi:hypothetical protein